MAADLEKRQSGLEERETVDKVIQQRMADGEIGVSHGTDRVIGVLMFLLASFITLLALYIVFQVNPAHYQL